MKTASPFFNVARVLNFNDVARINALSLDECATLAAPLLGELRAIPTVYDGPEARDGAGIAFRGTDVYRHVIESKRRTIDELAAVRRILIGARSWGVADTVDRAAGVDCKGGAR